MRAFLVRNIAGALFGSVLMMLGACAPDSSSVTRPVTHSEVARSADQASIGSPLLGVVASGNQIYPLDLGNRWAYERHLSQVLHPTDGSPQMVFDRRWFATRELVCEEAIGARTYRIERQTDELAGLGAHNWLWLRQDNAGLYEADVDISTVPACDDLIRVARAAAGPLEAAESAIERALADVPSAAARSAWRAALDLQREKIETIQAYMPGMRLAGTLRRGIRVPPEGELLRLSYPLRPGVNWLVRPDPIFSSRVEALENLEMPAGRFLGYRIRMNSQLFGATDRVYFWYGRDGYLRAAYHLLSLATDETGAITGTVVSDYDEVLTHIELVGQNGGGPRLAGR